MLYAFLEVMTLGIYLNHGIAYNVNKLLAQDRSTPVYVYQLDPIVAWELGIYRSAPSIGVQSQSQLPRSATSYLLLLKDAQMGELTGLGLAPEVVANGLWVDHKTGTLPRQLKLAKGIEPLEQFTLLKVRPTP
jgi:hypothetical protein